jgi:integrase-like protein
VRGGSTALSKSKTRAGERTIPLSPETARMLTRRRAAAKFAADADPIFPSEAGKPVDDHNYRQRVFKPAAKRAGVPWASPHKLRHGMASLMAERGYGAAEIAAMLGHADGGAGAQDVHPPEDPRRGLRGRRTGRPCGYHFGYHSRCISLTSADLRIAATDAVEPRSVQGHTGG